MRAAVGKPQLHTTVAHKYSETRARARRATRKGARQSRGTLRTGK